MGSASSCAVAETLPPRSIRRYGRFVVRLLLLGGALSVYPGFVLGTVYWKTLRSEFPGGAHGPRDAYRHTLASAIVAYTLSPRAVDWITRIMENDGDGSPARAMDAHNNRNGVRIAAEANSWSDLHRRVHQAIREGKVNAEAPYQSTWLPLQVWAERLY